MEMAMKLLQHDRRAKHERRQHENQVWWMHHVLPWKHLGLRGAQSNPVSLELEGTLRHVTTRSLPGLPSVLRRASRLQRYFPVLWTLWMSDPVLVSHHQGKTGKTFSRSRFCHFFCKVGIVCSRWQTFTHQRRLVQWGTG